MKMTRPIEDPYEGVKTIVEELGALYNISKSEKFEEAMKRVVQEEIPYTSNIMDFTLWTEC